MIMFAKREGKTVVQQLGSLFAFSTESVDNPFFFAEQFPMQADKFVEGFDTMHYQWFSHLCSQLGLTDKGIHLQTPCSTAYPVKSGFAYSHNLMGTDEREHSFVDKFRPMSMDVPGMQTDAEKSVGMLFKDIRRNPTFFPDRKTDYRLTACLSRLMMSVDVRYHD